MAGHACLYQVISRGQSVVPGAYERGIRWGGERQDDGHESHLEGILRLDRRSASDPSYSWLDPTWGHATIIQPFPRRASACPTRPISLQPFQLDRLEDLAWRPGCRTIARRPVIEPAFRFPASGEDITPLLSVTSVSAPPASPPGVPVRTAVRRGGISPAARE